MPIEAVEILAERLTDMSHEIRLMRQQMGKEHKDLADSVAKLSARVAKLEYDEKITRWLFGAGGALVAIALKEGVPLLLKWGG